MVAAVADTKGPWSQIDHPQTEPKTQAQAEAFAGKTYVMFVLDKSGSMYEVVDSTISGFNEWLGTVQREDPGMLMTLALFDTLVRTPVVMTRVDQVSTLDKTRYVPSGNTALYDAIGIAVRKTEEFVTPVDRALVIVLTDGQENSSFEWNAARIRALIADKEGLGNWTFTYMSSAPSAWADAATIGTQAGNVAAYAPTPAGTAAAMRRAARSTARYSAGATGQTVGNFYDDDDQATTGWTTTS